MQDCILNLSTASLRIILVVGCTFSSFEDVWRSCLVLEKIAFVRMIEVKEKLHREGLLVKIYFVERFDKI
jgi:hypothetical protein